MNYLYKKQIKIQVKNLKFQHNQDIKMNHFHYETCFKVGILALF